MSWGVGGKRRLLNSVLNWTVTEARDSILTDVGDFPECWYEYTGVVTAFQPWVHYSTSFSFKKNKIKKKKKKKEKEEEEKGEKKRKEKKKKGGGGEEE
jgi:predicted solute-binding protein